MFSGYLPILFLVIFFMFYINRDRTNKENFLRMKYTEEYDNFNLDYNIDSENAVGYEKYKRTVSDKAKLQDYIPTKTSELITTCDEKRNVCINY